MKVYANYHKHDHIGNFLSGPDTPFRCEDYLKRIKELGYDCYWTTNHGSGGDIFEARDLCDKYGIKCFFGLEGYIVPNPLEKDNRNYHIVIIPRTNAARKKVNLITSHASEEGYYYKPRIFIDDLLNLDADDVYITTACIGGIVRDEDAIELIFKPLVKKFGKNLFLEVQGHIETAQIEHNKICLELAKQYDIQLIAANDSHYIYPEQSKDRLEFLKGKGITRTEEDDFVLDYPDYDTMLNRFRRQGVLSTAQAEQAIDNTRIFETCEEIYLDKEIKMPTAYPNMTTDEKVEELKKHINSKFKAIRLEEGITGDKLKEYVDGIRYEMSIIEETKSINTADYFLLNEKIVDKAVNEYGGVLTRTGRGSCGAFYINRILGMTQIDRFNSPVKLYPERFISAARLLESRSCPDIDYNVASQEPFIKASRDILGEHAVYPMIAYGTMQIGEAFRNVCRSHGLSFDEFNDIAKNIDNYMEDPKWKPLIDEAKRYVGVVISASVHPCAHAMDNKDLRSEYGVVKVGDAMCVMITSGEADYWKVLKDDFLIVSVWGIISDTFKMIGKPIITVKQLLDDIDDRVWDIYANGITCTLNQVDSDYATALMKRYKAHSLRDMAQFTAAVRPSFDSWREGFIERQPFTTGSKELDAVLAETEGRITFQETLMTYFQWLGVTPAESISLIKKISKKKIHPEDFEKLETRLKDNWLKNTGNMAHFQETWDMVQSCMAYGFAAPHALATAIDSLYSAWLKVHYPLEYYTVVFGYYEGDMERTNKLTNELAYFGIKVHNIKFRHSGDKYTCDPSDNSIYKGVASVKYLNADVSRALYDMRNEQFDSFVNLLNVFPGNSRQLDILIKLDYFSEFGKAQKLLKIVALYEKLNGRKQLNKDDLPVPEDIVRQFCVNETAKRFQFDDKAMSAMLSHLCSMIPDTDIPAQLKIQTQIDVLGYADYVDPDRQRDFAVLDIDDKYNKTKITLYSIGYGKTAVVKLQKKQYEEFPFVVGDIIKCNFERKGKWSKVGDKFVQSDKEFETFIKAYVIC